MFSDASGPANTLAQLMMVAIAKNIGPMKRLSSGCLMTAMKLAAFVAKRTTRVAEMDRKMIMLIKNNSLPITRSSCESAGLVMSTKASPPVDMGNVYHAKVKWASLSRIKLFPAMIDP